MVIVTGSYTLHDGQIVYCSESVSMGEAVELFRLVAIIAKSVNLTFISEVE